MWFSNLYQLLRGLYHRLYFEEHIVSEYVLIYKKDNIINISRLKILSLFHFWLTWNAWLINRLLSFLSRPSLPVAFVVSHLVLTKENAPTIYHKWWLQRHLRHLKCHTNVFGKQLFSQVMLYIKWIFTSECGKT